MKILLKTYGHVLSNKSNSCKIKVVCGKYFKCDSKSE